MKTFIFLLISFIVFNSNFAYSITTEPKIANRYVITKANLQEVTGFTLVDSHTEQDVLAITDGATISLSSLDNTKLNIRANTSPTTVGSVKLELSGAQSKTYTDNAAPYALHGDNGSGNYYYGNWNPPATGTYTLKATPYSGSKATGTAGTPLTISFTITENGETPNDQVAPSVLSINRHSPTSSTTSATTVIYQAKFSELVNGVDVTDFIVTPVSGNLTANVSSVSSASFDGTSYDVTVNNINGVGSLRLDFRSENTGVSDQAGNGISGGFTAGQIYEIQLQQHTEGFTSVTSLDLASTHTNLGDQPQSKVWSYDGKWWAVFPTTGTGTHIWRLDGTTWKSVHRISPSAYTKADCKVIGNTVHIILYRGSLASELISVEYETTAGTYKAWSQRSSRTILQLESDTKTATIDVDSKGRMWLATNGNNSIYVRWSDSPYINWSSPITITTGISSDDISAIISLPSLNKIGVLWSNQITQRFGFKTHSDGSDASSWSTDEIPASQSALDNGAGMADDHLNMAVASDGTLYCAVKTGYKEGYPLIALLVRRPSGIWDNLYEVSQAGNRPIVILNEAMGKIKVIYAAPNAGGIYYKESSTSNISFGTEFQLIKESCDYATSAKDTYSSEIVIFASTNKQAYSVLASDDPSAISINDDFPDEQLKTKDITAYPNPFSVNTAINFTLSKTGNYILLLYDVKGRKIGELTQGFANAGEKIVFDMKGYSLSPGIYLVKVIQPGKYSTLKLMLSK